MIMIITPGLVGWGFVRKIALSKSDFTKAESIKKWNSNKELPIEIQNIG